jgi:hypothetical protein
MFCGRGCGTASFPAGEGAVLRLSVGLCAGERRAVRTSPLGEMSPDLPRFPSREPRVSARYSLEYA